MPDSSEKPTMFFKLTGGRHYDKKLRQHYTNGQIVPSKSDLSAIFPGKFVRDHEAEKSMSDPFAGDAPQAMASAARVVPGGQGEFAMLHPSAPAEMKMRAEQGEPGQVFATPTTAGEVHRGATAPSPRPAATEPENDPDVQQREEELAQRAEMSAEEKREAAGVGQPAATTRMASTEGAESSYKPVKSDLGDDVSEAYPEARRAGIVVLRSGSWYHVADAKDPNIALNDAGLRKEGVADAIKQYGG